MTDTFAALRAAERDLCRNEPHDEHDCHPAVIALRSVRALERRCDALEAEVAELRRRPIGNWPEEPNR